MPTLSDILARIADLLLGPGGRAAMIGADDDAMLVARPRLAVPR
jgi:hypothetical protein